MSGGPLTGEAVRVRLEILEELLHQRGGGSGGAPGVNWVIVANEAALALASGVNGQPAFSLAARTEWIANTTDLGPAIPNQKVTNPGGGFWVRTQFADQKWRDQIDVGLVPAWTIAALTGNDENPGTPAAPLQTHAEWARRIGNFGQWHLAGQVTVTYPTIAEVPPATDPLTLDDAPISNYPPGGTPRFLTFQGPPPEVKAGHGGLITAVTARVRATNTAFNVTTTGLLDASDVGLRLEITAGPRAGAVTYVSAVTGANQVRTSEWEIADLGPTTFADTHVTPSNAGADTTQVFTQGQIFVNAARFRGGSQGSLLFKDLDLSAVTPGDPMQFFAEGGGIMFVYCRFLSSAAFYTRVEEAGAGFFWGLMFQLACFEAATEAGLGVNMTWPEGDYLENIINGGLYKGAVIANGGAMQWDADAMADGGAIGATGGGAFIIGAGSAYNAPLAGGVNIGSNSLGRASTLFYGIAAVYGQGNATAGLLIAQRFSYDNPGVLAGMTITGLVDFVLGTPATAVFWNAATSTFLPVGGFATSWANMAVAQPAGLGGEAHNPARSAEIIQATPLIFP